jgi:hypothetical protein
MLWAKVVLFIGSAILLCGCNGGNPKPGAPQSRLDAGTSVTVLVDLSGSFAPLAVRDRIILLHVANALVEAAKEWAPPIRVVWRAIGAESVSREPLCEVQEFLPRLLDGADYAAKFAKKIQGCANTIVDESEKSRRGELFTDISGALGIATAGTGAGGHNYLIAYSDFIEDRPEPARAPISFAMPGYKVLMIHRPGAKEPAGWKEYGDRMRSWKQRFIASGAAEATDLPAAGVTTVGIVNRLLSRNLLGTTATLIIDLDLQQTDRDRLTTLAQGISQAAREWSDPVTVRWLATGPRPTVSYWPAVVFQPRIVPRTGEVNTMVDFRVALEEAAAGISRTPFARSGTAGISQALGLAAPNEAPVDRREHLIILSDLSADLPSPSAMLKNVTVMLVYVARPQPAGTAQDFLNHLEMWKRELRTGSRDPVCALDWYTLTDRAVAGCLKGIGGKQ